MLSKKDIQVKQIHCYKFPICESKTNQELLLKALRNSKVWYDLALSLEKKT